MTAEQLEERRRKKEKEKEKRRKQREKQKEKEKAKKAKARQEEEERKRKEEEEMKALEAHVKSTGAMESVSEHSEKKASREPLRARNSNCILMFFFVARENDLP